ncbi:hypothetical protein EPYR_02068 [Erwinia pyrifoliae DSM 12163]|nr:hypothetical protein EPYR_02068 [Erwinia pyrifoliae DSM 12163]
MIIIINKTERRASKNSGVKQGWKRSRRADRAGQPYPLKAAINGTGQRR